MKVKKSDRVNLEKFKLLFTMMGLNLALLVVLLAFESSSRDLAESSLGNLAVQDHTEEEIDITQQAELAPEVEMQEPEQAPLEEQIIETLVVVDDDKEVKGINIDSEATEKTQTKTTIVDVVVAPVVVEEEYVAPVSFAVVEEKPEYPGGDAAMLQFIKDNIVYPPTAKEIGIQGRVYVQFVVDKNGNVTQVKTAKSVDPYLDAEAERVVKKMPAWSPGKQRGKSVPVTYMLPINFKLN